MPDQKGWPDAGKPGSPIDPNQEGPHWIEDEYSWRRWFWWNPITEAWSGASRQEPPLIAGERWIYIGPASVPNASTPLGQTPVHTQPRRR